ncbi:MAG TPA: sulfatase-like hydrolase/transferase [Flavitalea sp.]|nr:sulfatase-like hydrolase/transferase [Flavitalea sp.]
MQLTQRLRHFAFHFILLVVFFLTNGYSDYVGLIPVQDMLLYFLLMSGGGVLLFLLFRRLLGNNMKAGIFVTVFLFFWLFYGAIQDGLKLINWLHGVAAHRYLVPGIILSLVLLFRWLRRTANDNNSFTLYLNTLLLICILYDVVNIVTKEVKKDTVDIISGKQEPVNLCSDCPRPDIFLIILDEYSGTRVLNNYFHYNNAPFEEFLSSKGFYVVANPSSNYSATPFSMAATFDMDYLSWDKKGDEMQGYARAAKTIPQSPVVQILKKQGYAFYNYSIFDLADQPSVFHAGFLPLKLNLITFKTIPNRVRRDFFWRVQVRNKGTEALLAWLSGSIRYGNEKMISLTKQASASKTDQPKFIYTHLIMPHAPYVFDSAGKKNVVDYSSPEISEIKKQQGYLQYLQYTTGRAKELVQEILINTNGEAVIIIMSDHGYRDRQTMNGCIDLNNNFQAVYLPSHQYKYYYNSISSVNQFRVLFNSLFATHFALLPDTCRF